MEVNVKSDLENIPALTLGMEHKVILSERQKGYLLQERQVIIEESIQAIQSNFFKIGRALAEIKKFKLHKADQIYPSWKEFVKHRIVPQLHQSTISDYIAIVKMQIENADFIYEQDLIRLGYKKVKLLKSKLNLIDKEKDHLLKKKLRLKFKTEYQKSFKEYKNLPYTTYEYVFNFVPNSKKPQNEIKEKITDHFVVQLNTKKHVITITAKKNDQSKLESFFNNFS